MRLLLDSCVWGGALRELVAAGHDVLSVRTWGSDPGDEEILKRAHGDARILITLDKDFGELAIVRGLPHAGIVRLVGIAARQQARAASDALAMHGAEAASGAIITNSIGFEFGRRRDRCSNREAPTTGKSSRRRSEARPLDLESCGAAVHRP